MPPRPNGPPIAMRQKTPGVPTSGRNAPPQPPEPMAQQQGTRLAPVRQSQALVQRQRELPPTTLRSNTMVGTLASSSILRQRLLSGASSAGIRTYAPRPAATSLVINGSGGRSGGNSIAVKFNEAAIPTRLTSAPVISSSKFLFFRDAQRLARIDTATGGHTFSRHGAQTTLTDQRERAVSGRSPDGSTSTPANSTRFLTNEDHLNAYRVAIRRYRAAGLPKNFNCTFTMPKEIGEGYFKGGVKFAKTNKVRVWFSNGRITTMYPDIR
jgi:hypothetical protein